MYNNIINKYRVRKQGEENMASVGDRYTVALSETHLMWGTYRNTYSRNRRYGEGYIKIPLCEARRIGMYNSNNSHCGIGFNEFRFTTSDEFLSGILKSSGCSKAGSCYAKNLHVSGDLRGLGQWFAHVNAIPGDMIEVRFITPIDIVLTHLPQ